MAADCADGAVDAAARGGTTVALLEWDKGKGGQVTLCMLRDVVRRGGDQPSWTRAVRVALPLMHPIATRLEIRGERECVT